ncbi:LamG domain-containing protein, partial [Candidatus Gracilibacteria bacterium]|nr:LamG domain-containing protein [Candidatus Gracilibacteria bacterium]
PSSNFYPCTTTTITITGRTLSAGTGTRTVYMRGVDKLGNIGSNFSDDIIVDSDPPNMSQSLIFSGTTGQVGSTLYFKPNVDIRSYVSDTAGIDQNSCEYTINNGSNRSTATYSGNANAGYCVKTGITYQGNITINFRVRDIVNNLNTGTATTYIYDGAAPIIIFTGSNPAPGATVTNNTMTSQMQITESGIGLKQFTYNRDGSNYSVYDSGLVLMMNFDNVASLGENASIVKDVSQYNHTGIIANGATWTGNGVHNGAFDFDGPNYPSIGPVINVSDSDALDVGFSTSMTISFWIKNDSNVCAAITKKSGMREIYRCSSTITARFQGASDYSSPTSLTNGERYHVTVVRNIQNNKTSIYLDGILDSESTYTVGTPTTTNGIGIGAYYGGSYSIDGQLDEFRIYNRALSTGEIDLLYRSNLNKFSTTQWLFTDERMCMLNDTYTYTGYASDLFNNSYATGRTNIVNIPDYDVITPLSFNLGNVNAGGIAYTLSGQFPTDFQVQDQRGTTGRHTTIQLPLALSGTVLGTSIPGSNIYTKSDLTVVGSNTNNLNINPSMSSYVNGANPITHISRVNSTNPYQCPIGTYGNKPWLKVDVPAWTNPGTYSGTLTYDIVQ